jgi:type IV secretion system protein VirB10
MIGSTPPPAPPATLPPGRRRIGRRLNRVPAIILCLALVVIAGAVTYTLHERSVDENRRRDLAKAVPAGSDASGFLKDKPSGYIGIADVNLGPRASAPPPSKAPTPPPPEDDNGREAERKKAWARYWAEYDAVKEEKFNKRKESLADLKTEQPATGGRGGGGGETQLAAAAPAASTAPATSGFGSPSAANGFNSWWGGGGGGGGALPGFGGFYPGLQTPQIDREGQEQKLQFAGQKGDLGKDDVVPTVRKPPDPLALMAGSFVKFTTINEVNSDVPGTTIGMVAENVYNTSNGSCVLIPQGSKLIGHYNSIVSTGQDRLPGVLTRIIFPDGSSQAIGAMESADNSGSAGQEDQVNRHLIQKFGSALIAGMFGAAIQLSVPHNAVNGYDSTQIIAASLGQQMGQLGQQIALQNLSIPNTLTIRAGYRGTMITDKDIHISPPWSCSGTHRNLSLPIMAIQ